MIEQPSHWTPLQVARITNKALSTICWHMKPGRILEPEVYHGVRMIPDWKVTEYQRLIARSNEIMSQEDEL